MFRSLVCSLIFQFRLGDTFLILMDSFNQLHNVPGSAVTLPRLSIRFFDL